jgi:hypothetical protein
LGNYRITGGGINDFSRKSREFKMLPHKFLSQYKYSLWIDGNFLIKGSVRNYINKWIGTSSLMVMIHPQRDCIYDEATACIDLNKENKQIIDRLLLKYRIEGFPSHYGLYANGILFRRHFDKNLISLEEQWWDMLNNYSKRDQLLLSYLLWKEKFNVDIAKENYWKNEYFERRKHLK